MNFEDALQKAVHDITTNHNKIIDDWCKAYMAQRYIEGKSIDVGSFTLCQQNLSWAQNEVGFKYWFEDGKPEFKDEIYSLVELIEMAKQSEYGYVWYSEKGPIQITKEGKLEPI